MLLHRMIADHKLIGDGLVGQSVVHELRHPLLRLCQRQHGAGAFQQLSFLFPGDGNPVIPVDDPIGIALIVRIDCKNLIFNNPCLDPVCRKILLLAAQQERQPAAWFGRAELFGDGRAQDLF